MANDEPTPHPEPVELGGGSLHNFKLAWPLRFDRAGRLVDADGFKRRLVSTIKKPITLEEYERGVRQPLIVKVRVFVVNSASALIAASFSACRATERAGHRGVIVEHILERHGAEARFVPPLGKRERGVLDALGHDADEAGPFDSLGPSGKRIEEFVRAELGLPKRDRS